MRRKTLCIYVDAGLAGEAAKAAEERGVSLSWLVEDALRLYVLFLRRPEPQARRAKRAGRKPPSGRREEAAPADSPCGPQGCASAAAPQSGSDPQASPQLPPHLQNNNWIAVLRSRR